MDPLLVEDCIFTGKKFSEDEPCKWKAVKKFRKGELVAVYREYDEHYYVITAYWNTRG